MTIRALRLATSVLALALPACSGEKCGYVSPISDASQGTITYSPVGRTCGGNVLVGGTFPVLANSDYAATPASGPTVGSVGQGTVQVNGGFDDAAPAVIDFTLTATSIASGASALGSDSQLCVDNPDNACDECMPVSGTLTASTYGSTCYGDQGCTLDIAGALTATATGSQGTFTFSLQLAHQDEWVPQSCSTESGG